MAIFIAETGSMGLMGIDQLNYFSFTFAMGKYLTIIYLPSLVNNNDDDYEGIMYVVCDHFSRIPILFSRNA